MAIEAIIAVFLDGVGLGDNDITRNPFAAPNGTPFLTASLGGNYLLRDTAGISTDHATLVGLDATLGVEGLPQSGTGQTTILTGKNAAAHLGRHDGPYPNAALKSLLATESIFRKLQFAGKPVAFANAYPNRFLNRLTRGTERLSANTRAALSAELKLRNGDDLRNGTAVSALLTNRYWREWGYDVPLLDGSAAGVQLARLSHNFSLTFFEVWHTDVVGHKQNAADAAALISLLDDFFAGIVGAVDLRRTLVLVISDHGNLEDLSTRKHTVAPALCLAMGAGHEQILSLRSLVDIAPFVLAQLG